MRKTKLILTLLAFMMFGVMNAEIASGTCGKYGDNITWVLDDDGTLTLSGSGEMMDYNIQSLAPWYDYRDIINKLLISEDITSIGRLAFYDCYSISSITIGKSLTSIGDLAFMGCRVKELIYADGCTTALQTNIRSITTVTIPNSVKSIEQQAFAGCIHLTSVTIPNSVKSIGNGAFSGCESLSSIKLESGNTNYDCRDNCNALIETKTNTLIAGFLNTTIPNSVKSIGEEAFKDFSALTSIIIPNSITNIGNGAFKGCTGLKSIIIPDSVKSIGEYAFYDCSNLTSVTIPDSVKSIGRSAFGGHNNLKDEDGICYGGKWALCTKHNSDSVNIKEGTIGIAGGAFSSCYSLASVTIPNSVTSIGDWAFEGCYSLTSIVIPNSVTSIGDWAFAFCM